MHRIQEVVRMGRDTIRTYQEKLREAGLLEGSPDDLPDIETLKEAIAAEPAAPQASVTLRQGWRGRCRGPGRTSHPDRIGVRH